MKSYLSTINGKHVFETAFVREIKREGHTVALMDSSVDGLYFALQ